MKLKILLFTLVLWSCGLARGLSSAFVKVDKESFSEVTDERFDISNRMPRIRNGGSLGVCFGISAAYCAQHYICDQKQISDCKNLKPTEEIAPLSGVAWANPNRSTGGVPDIRNHVNIQFQGGGSNALKNAAYSDFIFQAESCFPFDQFVNKFGKNKDVINGLLNKYESQFKKSKTEGVAVCEECLKQEIYRDLSVGISTEQLKQSFAKETFGEFLYSLFFRDCPNLVEFEPKPNHNMYPGVQRTADYAGMIDQVKKVLKKGIPLNMDGICPEYTNEVRNGKIGLTCVKEKNGNPAIHSLAITGYEKRCRKDNPKVCEELLRVHNSWGEDWQRQFDGGWVSASKLIESIKIARPDFGSNVLSWYTNPKKESL